MKICLWPCTRQNLCMSAGQYMCSKMWMHDHKIISGSVLEMGDYLDTAYCYSHPILFSQYTSLPSHYASISHHPTSPSPCWPLMLSLSLTHLDSLPHEPSFLVPLPLVRAHFLYLFKTVVTGCISLTWIYLVLSDIWTLAPWEGG